MTCPSTRYSVRQASITWPLGSRSRCSETEPNARKGPCSHPVGRITKLSASTENPRTVWKGSLMARDWAKVAAEVVELVGGQENITSVTHCVTRLRFQLKDESVADDNAIGALDGVIQGDACQWSVSGGHRPAGRGSLRCGARAAAQQGCRQRARGQFRGREQEHQGQAYGHHLGRVPAHDRRHERGRPDQGPGRHPVDLWLGRPVVHHLHRPQLHGDGFFQFLPLFLGYTAAQKLGATPFLGMAVGAFLCHPSKWPCRATSTRPLLQLAPTRGGDVLRHPGHPSAASGTCSRSFLSCSPAPCSLHWRSSSSA